MHLKLKLIAVLSITLFAYHVDAGDKEYCSVENARETVLDACSYLVEHVKKRATDLSDYGYNVELVKARHHHHRHPYAKKITHADFPKGGYILVHYPQARHIFSSNSNQIAESVLSGENEDNELSNDVLTNDMRASSVHRRNESNNKNKHHMRFQREADLSPVDFCCTHESQCQQYNCH